VMVESGAVNATATEPSGNPGGELLTTEQMADWHNRMNACQSFDDASEFYTALDTLSPLQRQQFDSSVPVERWNWLFALPEMQAPVPPESESVPESLELESEPQPTLEELKALLLACNTLTALNELKRSHRKTIATAYHSMSEKEQTHVDALRALTVPHKVFKYLGDEIRLGGTERLIRGTLVYLDPQVQVRSSTRSAPVWAINGVGSGWVRPIEVSLSLLQEVVKAGLPKTNQQDSDQQMGLI